MTVRLPTLSGEKTAVIDVNLAVDSADESQSIKLTVNRLTPQDRLTFSALNDAYYKALNSGLDTVASRIELHKFLIMRVVGWSGVVNDEEQPVEFSQDLLAQWLAADSLVHRRVTDAVDDFFYTRPTMTPSKEALKDEKKPLDSSAVTSPASSEDTPLQNQQ